MLINGSSGSSMSPVQALNSASQAGQTTQSKPHHGHRHAGGDQVQISDLASQLAASDPSKLAQLQAAHTSGTYQVSPSQVAKSIINAHMIGA